VHYCVLSFCLICCACYAICLFVARIRCDLFVMVRFAWWWCHAQHAVCMLVMPDSVLAIDGVHMLVIIHMHHPVWICLASACMHDCHVRLIALLSCLVITVISHTCRHSPATYIHNDLHEHNPHTTVAVRFDVYCAVHLFRHCVFTCHAVYCLCLCSCLCVFVMCIYCDS
jgi:hypothetical protein